MTNFTNYSYHFNTQEIQDLFQKYNLRPEHPIDYQKFVEDVHRVTTVVQTILPEYNFTGVNIEVAKPQ